MGKVLDYCTLVGAFLLVSVAICGPFYAFFIVSCVSTLPCNIRSVMSRLGATCAEAIPGGHDGQELLHGERCTIVCNDPSLEPTQPELLCIDGSPPGVQTLQCVEKKVFVPPMAGGLIEGAITGGELRTACVRAQYLECKATPGGTALLMQLQNVSKKKCSELLEECKTFNRAFSFSSHVSYIDGEEMGICSLGCYVLAVPEGEEGAATARLPVPTPAPSGFAPPKTLSDRPKCPGSPMCINVNTSCNPDDNGDYYRYPFCATGQPQWVKLDESRRIRYDNRPQLAQGGKWILEGPVNPSTDAYGEELARQPNFNMLPVYQSTDWNYKCRLSAFKSEYRSVEIELATCTCDSWNDCNNNGVAVGSKEFGAACSCKCYEGYLGERCEIKLCKAPGVLYAPVPPCREGLYIPQGGTCTAVCDENFEPNHETFQCPDDGSGLRPTDFECTRSPTAMQDATEEEFGKGTTTTPIPDCSDLDCSYLGKPLGPKERDAEGLCICECRANFSGKDCSIMEGSCTAPFSVNIPHSNRLTCAEGMEVKSECTPLCEEGYYPLPSKLRCTTEGVLDPPKFGCFGGPDPRELWCDYMKVIAVSGSALAMCTLFMFCFCKCEQTSRIVQGFMTRGEAVVVKEDDDGKFYVVRCEGTVREPDIPKRILDRTLKVQEQERLDQQCIERGRFTSASLLYMPDTLMAIDERQSDIEEIEEYNRSLQAGYIEGAAYTEGFKDMSIVREQLENLQQRQLEMDWATDPMSPASVDGSTRGPAAETQTTLRQLAEMAEEVPSPGSVAAPAWRKAQGGTDDLGSPQEGFRSSSTAVGAQPAMSNQFTGSGNATSSTCRPPTALELIAASRNATVVQAPAPQKPDVGGPNELLLKTQPEDLSWSKRILELEEQSLHAKRQEGLRRKMEANKASADAAARIKGLLAETAQERADIEAAIKAGLQAGDPDMLRAALQEAKNMLERLAGLPPGPTATLVRLSQIAETRVDQFDERERARQGLREHEERIERGEAPDWTITPEQLWRYVEQCNVAKVRAGMRAKLPVQTKSKDGKRLTVLHIAARGACKEGAEATATQRLQVMEALLKAGANANATDSQDRTPLDLAVCEGGPGAEEKEIIEEMRNMGFMTLKEAGEAAIKEASTVGGSPRSPGSPNLRSPASPSHRGLSRLSSPTGDGASIRSPTTASASPRSPEALVADQTVRISSPSSAADASNSPASVPMRSPQPYASTNS